MAHVSSSLFNDYPDQMNSDEMNKCLLQVQRKRDYNRRYYESKIKPQKLSQKRELEMLRERCAQLEQNQNQDVFAKITHQSEALLEKINQLEQETQMLREMLELSRQRNYELLMNNADQYLPKLQNSSLT